MTDFQGASNTANLASGLASSIAAFQQMRSARKSMRAQAEFIEQIAEQEAQAILDAGDANLQAYSLRASELLEEEALNRFSGEARARESRAVGERMVARIQAQNAARGVSISEGSPLELAAEMVYESEKQAANEELITKLNSENLLNRANQELKAGQAVRFASKLQARTTLLTAKARATGIRTQAPTFSDILSTITRPLASLNAERLESGIEPIKSIFSKKNPSSTITQLNPTPETTSQPRIYGNL